MHVFDCWEIIIFSEHLQSLLAPDFTDSYKLFSLVYFY